MTLVLRDLAFLTSPTNLLYQRAGAYPSLDLRFAENKSLVDATTGAQLVTFTRASSATYVDSQGVIQSASTNVPRFDHNPVTGESLGLLVEEQRSNLCLHSRTLTDAAWVKTNITAARDQVGVTGGSNTASSILATAANSTILQTITSASAARATSAYVKRITGTGTVEMTQDNGSTWTAVTVSNDWTRVIIPSATVTNPVVGFRLVTDTDAIAVDFVQLETGAFSTSAIETTTAAVTRSADVASISGSNFGGWYQQTGGTMFAEYLIPSLLDGTVVSFDDGTNNNRWQMRYMSSPNRGRYRFISPSGTLDMTSATALPVANQISKSAYVAVASDQAWATNAVVSAATGSQATMPTVDRMQIGVGAASDQARQLTIRRLTYWPARLSNPTLQAITQ